MSFVALGWAWDQRLAPTHRMVLMALADRVNKTSGRCDPSIQTIADDALLSVRAVQDSLAHLEAVGLLSIRKRENRTSQYDLNLTLKVVSKGESAELIKAYDGGAEYSPPLVQNMHPPGAPDAPPPPQDVHPPGAVGAPKPRKPNLGKETIGLLPLGDAPKPKTAVLFEEWYAAYPRKVSKGAAEKAYAKAISKGVDPGLLLSTVKTFPFDFKEGGKWIPHPATWLNDERYLDKPVSLPAKGGRLIYCGQVIDPRYYRPNTREQVLALPVPAAGHKDREAYLDAQNGCVASLPKGEWK